MIIYQDIIGGDDEMFSDAFDPKLVDDIVYEVDCKMITVKEGDVDIGANPSAEEAGESLDDTAATVNNVVHSFRLQPTSFDKKSYTAYIGGYLKAVKAKLDPDPKSEKVKTFEKAAGAYFTKKILPKLKEQSLDFYTGESMNPEGMVALLDYREDGITPYLIFWKDGLKEMKV